MGLQVSEKETLYYRKQMYETMKVHGIRAIIESIGNRYNESYDFYNDIKGEDSFDNRVRTYLTYEQHPNIKTLRSYGWYIETEDMPIVAYIPVMYIKPNGDPASFHPAVDDKVILTVNSIDDISSTREFLIKDFKGLGFPNTIYYTIRLVPYRSVDDEIGELYD